MRELNMSNLKDRDAQVLLGTRQVKARYGYQAPGGTPVTSTRLVKGTLTTQFEALTKEVSAEDLSTKMIEGDPEIDLELFGKRVEETNRLYLNSENQPAYGVVLKEQVYLADGSLKEERAFQDTEANINTDRPLKLNDKLVIPKSRCMRMFAFTGCYQVQHSNGLTYDFLYDIAKDLETRGVMMMLGAGDKKNQPLVISRNGTPCRGFLEGRTQDDKYLLLLHMTNLELKPLPKPDTEEDA